MKNLSIDLHRVAKVVEDQVAEIDKAVKCANDAMDQANKAVDNSAVNKESIIAIDKAADEAKRSAKDALDKIKSLATNDTIKDIQNSLKNAADDVAKLKQSQVDQLKTVTGQINNAVAQAKADAASFNAKTEALTQTVKNMQGDIVSAKQSADQASVTAVDAKSNAATAIATAKQVTIDMKNAKSDILAAKATASEASITAGNAASDAATAKVTASGASAVATNAKNDVAKISETVDDINTSVAGVTKKVNDTSNEVTKTQTELDQTKKQLSLKADQTTVDDIKSKALQNAASLDIINNEIKSKVDSTTVDKLIDSKGFTTADTVQSIVDQKANGLTQTINEVKTTVDKNGELVSSVSDKVSNFSQTIDGLQTLVKDKASQSQFNQLSNQLLAKVSTKDYQAEMALMKQDLNLRIHKGDVISQLNLEAGGDGLIQVANGKGKLLLDADSVVFKNKAFIPSAAIIDIAADKITSGTLDAGNIRVINLTADNIHGGTLDVGNMHVKNFTANDIKTGTLSGVTFRSGSDSRYFQTSGNNIYWVKSIKDNNFSLIGADGAINAAGGLEIADTKVVQISNFNGATVDDDGNIKTVSGIIGFPRILLDGTGRFNPTYATGDDFSNGDGKQSIYQWTGTNEFTRLASDFGFQVYLDENNPNSQFAIQKNNRLGIYAGQGKNGDQFNITSLGGVTFDKYTSVTVDKSLQVQNLHIKGYKNAVVNSSQGYIAVNAYETAEYYFGDIGESNTGDSGEVVVGIDRIFNETVNTSIQYQVFITPYSDCHVWVEKRYGNRFVVKSDKPNAEFGWELKAKRKGYESSRLLHVDGIK